MALDQLFDYLAVRLNGERAAGREITINFKFTDPKADYALKLKNGVLNYHKKFAEKPDATFTLTRANLNDVILGQSTAANLIKEGKITSEGNGEKMTELVGLLDKFDFWFNIVTPHESDSRR